MDPLDFLEPEQLLRFLHCQKTELSCMEKPQIFLNQLRDHNLIPEDRYKKVSRMKSKENMKNALYDILDWLERERSQHIHLFWSCVFKETIMNNYPILRLLRNSLMDGSFHFNTQLPEKVEKEETNERKGKELLEDKKKEKVNSVKKRRKRVCDDDDDEEEEEEGQPGPSSQLTPHQRKKLRKICFYSPLKKGEKSDIWNWPLYKSQLPVTCGSQEGVLSRERLAKGEKCISVKTQWFTPTEFESFAEKASSRNWKLSIKCNGTPLGNLIKEGHLAAASYIGNKKKQRAKRSLFQCDQLDSDEDEGSEEQTEQESNEHSVFQVTCRDVAGTLYRKRFASGTRGKCIRTETSWLTPTEFVEEASCQTNISWKKDIMCNGEPISVLIEANILRIHSLLCTCTLCQEDQKELENQKNDDECWVCKGAEVVLVMCDNCPRSFHQECHLPHVDDADLGDDRQWMCTLCIATQDWRHSDRVKMEVALSYPVSQHLLECHYLLLCLKSTEESRKIALILSIEMENSSSVNQSPLWLDIIEKELQMEKYQTIRDFVSGIGHIFTTCTSENQDNNEVLSMVGRLKEIFNQKFNTVFNICEGSGNCLQ